MMILFSEILVDNSLCWNSNVEICHNFTSRQIESNIQLPDIKVYITDAECTKCQVLGLNIHTHLKPFPFFQRSINEVIANFILCKDGLQTQTRKGDFEWTFGQKYFQISYIDNKFPGSLQSFKYINDKILDSRRIRHTGGRVFQAQYGN